MKKSFVSALAVIVVVALSSAGCSSANAGGSKLNWRECPKGVAAPGVECTTLKVPLDYKKPDGKKIEIAVSRLASKNPDKRHGVLLTNSGGPGGQTLTMPATLKKIGVPLHSVARNHALIDGNKPTAWLAMRVFLWFNGAAAGTVPPPVSVAGPFVEEVAQDNVDVPVIAKCLAVWSPVS